MRIEFPSFVISRLWLPREVLENWLDNKVFGFSVAVRLIIDASAGDAKHYVGPPTFPTDGPVRSTISQKPLAISIFAAAVVLIDFVAMTSANDST